MNRRNFLTTIATGVIVANFYQPDLAATKDAPQISFTLDDFYLFDTPVLSAEQRNRSILDAFRSHSNLKAAMFVAGKFIDSEEKRGYLAAWNEAGHIIGNHTYSHFRYHDKSFETF